MLLKLINHKDSLKIVENIVKLLLYKELTMDKQKIKDLLEQKAKDLSDKLNLIESDAIRNPLSSDSEDRSQQIENDDVLNELDSVEAKELQQVKFALRRLENGEYGQCNACGEQISESRLNALPYANVCIECAKDAENA